MTARQQRMVLVALIVVGVGTATAFGIKAFQNNLEYFYSPSEILADNPPEDRVLRLGGMVEQGSIRRAEGSLRVDFVVTDFAENVAVSYTGVLPDLFNEGQGVVAIGRMSGSEFVADTILAKHDESYMPPEVTKALNKAASK